MLFGGFFVFFFVLVAQCNKHFLQDKITATIYFEFLYKASCTDIKIQNWGPSSMQEGYS